MKTIAALLLLCLATSAANAQPVYRCGNAYSQLPCTGGPALVVANDARSDAQRTEGRRVAADERRLATEMQRDRMAEEKAAGTPKSASSLSGVEPAKSSASADSRRDVGKKKRAAARQDENTVVVVVGSNAVKRRARAD